MRLPLREAGASCFRTRRSGLRPSHSHSIGRTSNGPTVSNRRLARRNRVNGAELSTLGVVALFRLSVMDRVLRRSTLGRYAFAVAAVAVAFALRLALLPLTGSGAPFLLFFGATMATSLLVGIGPALLTLALTLPVVAAFLIVPAGGSTSEAVFQGLLFAIDGLVLIYLTTYANRQRERTRQTVELSPDAY